MPAAALNFLSSWWPVLLVLALGVAFAAWRWQRSSRRNAARLPDPSASCASTATAARIQRPSAPAAHLAPTAPPASAPPTRPAPARPAAPVALAPSAPPPHAAAPVATVPGGLSAPSGSAAPVLRTTAPAAAPAANGVAPVGVSMGVSAGRPSGPVSPDIAKPAVEAASPALLLVDDSAVVRAKLRKLLEGAGHQVLQARDGLEALALLDARRVQLVITDIEMPNMDGLQLIESLAQRADTRLLPVLAISGNSDLHQRLSLHGSVRAVFHKPWVDHELLRQVQLHLPHRPQVSNAQPA